MGWRSKKCIISQKYWIIELYYLHLIFDLHMIALILIDLGFYYCIDRSNVRLVVGWLFEYWDFVWRRLRLLYVVELDRLLVTCKTVDRLILSMWTDFLMWNKKLAAEKYLKIKCYDLCEKLNVWRKYQRKTSSINLKLV